MNGKSCLIPILCHAVFNLPFLLIKFQLKSWSFVFINGQNHNMPIFSFTSSLFLMQLSFFIFIGQDLPWREGKVDKCDFGRDFWCIVRIWQLGCNVELEVIVVWDHCITKLDHCATLLLEGLKLA